MKITFIQTGGTIDKDYPHTSNGWAFEIGEPAVKRILHVLQPSFEYDIVEAFRKDSLEINDDDRGKLVELIRKQDTDKIIITHGTDTMVETGAFLSESITNKIIVITGAMKPERFKDSEAFINVGSAITMAQTMPPGVYICMHGIAKSWNEIKRNKETGKFY